MGSTHSEWDPAFPGSNVVAPRDFKRIFSDFKPQFAGWKQQDPRKMGDVMGDHPALMGDLLGFHQPKWRF